MRSQDHPLPALGPRSELMAIVTGSNPHGALDDEHLLRFEVALGVQLPEQYRQFLVAHNGARLDPDEVIFPGESEPFTFLEQLFGLHNGADSLDAVRANVEGYVPDDAIAFAEDHGGNLFCLGLRGNYRGRVFFWHHEHSRPGVTRGDWHGMTLLAESFTIFLAALGGPQPGASVSAET